MRIVYFAHSLLSCWNNGNAHFLRGVLRELVRRGHDVVAFEASDNWSRANLTADHGEDAIATFHAAYPELTCQRYDRIDLPRMLDGAHVVIVHEWNEPALLTAIGRARRRGGRFTLLFHDTHHRAVSDPASIRAFELEAYDGILAFGAALADVYRRLGWGDRAFVWHEAADISLFKPPHAPVVREGIVWIGNWGDGERGREIEEFLLKPAHAAALALDVHGVRYPPDARVTLSRYGASYRGWLANVQAPSVFARHLATVHVPRRYYAGALPGIPTIRMFEALACAIPLLCAPWEDAEHLFRPGDYLLARSAAEMTRHLKDLRGDAHLRERLAQAGRRTILARHTCAHRADELLTLLTRLRAGEQLGMTA